ncbi:MAG TPA: transcription antitermination factor NusB [Gammaproteobacteria bacterium]
MQTRRLARQRALQALYQWELNPGPVSGLLEQFLTTQDMENVDMEYFTELLRQSIALCKELDERLETYLDIPAAQLDPVERGILRLSAYELIRRLDIPYRVIISEAVALAKKFGAEDGHKFINAVLDKAVSDWRPHEGRNR